jgi:hypothetical protein
MRVLKKHYKIKINKRLLNKRLEIWQKKEKKCQERLMIKHNNKFRKESNLPKKWPKKDKKKLKK